MKERINKCNFSGRETEKQWCLMVVWKRGSYCQKELLVCEKSPSTVQFPGMFPTQIKEEVTHVLQQHKEGSGEEGSGTPVLYWETISSLCNRSWFLFYFFWSCVGLHFPNYSSYDKKRPSELHHISAASPVPIVYCLLTYSTCCAPLPLSITYSVVCRKWGNSFLLFSQMTVFLWWHCNPGGGEGISRG